MIDSRHRSIYVAMTLALGGCATVPPPVTEGQIDVRSAKWLQHALSHAETMIADVHITPGGRTLSLNDYSISLATMSYKGQRHTVIAFELIDGVMYTGLGFPREFAITVNEEGGLEVH